MIKSHQFECNDLQDIMFAMEQEFNELKTEALHDFQSQKDEIKNKVFTLVYGFVIEILNSCLVKSSAYRIFHPSFSSSLLFDQSCTFCFLPHKFSMFRNREFQVGIFYSGCLRHVTNSNMHVV